MTPLDPPRHSPFRANTSRRPLQVDRLRTRHEEQRIQNHRREQVSSCHRVSTRAAGVEADRSAGEYAVSAIQLRVWFAVYRL